MLFTFSYTHKLSRILPSNKFQPQFESVLNDSSCYFLQRKITFQIHFTQQTPIQLLLTNNSKPLPLVVSKTIRIVVTAMHTRQIRTRTISSGVLFLFHHGRLKSSCDLLKKKMWKRKRIKNRHFAKK